MKTKLLSAILIASCISGYAQTTVTSPVTGRVWMDRNLGATQVATTTTDESAIGNLYQWGRAADGHELQTSALILDSDGVTAGEEGSNFIYSNWNYNDWLTTSDDTRWQEADAVNNPCPDGFVIPTVEEFLAETDITNADTGLSSFLKLPLGYQRSMADGVIYNDVTWAELGYWTSTVTVDASTLPGHAQMFKLDATTAIAYDQQRIYGHPVRCIQKTATASVDDALLINFEIYPNPASASSGINYKVSNAVNNVKISVYDITGKAIYKQENQDGKINLPNISQGLYLVKFVLNDKAVVVKELIIK